MNAFESEHNHNQFLLDIHRLKKEMMRNTINTKAASIVSAVISKASINIICNYFEKTVVLKSSNIQQINELSIQNDILTRRLEDVTHIKKKLSRDLHLNNLSHIVDHIDDKDDNDDVDKSDKSGGDKSSKSVDNMLSDEIESLLNEDLVQQIDGLKIENDVLLRRLENAEEIILNLSENRGEDKEGTRKLLMLTQDQYTRLHKELKNEIQQLELVNANLVREYNNKFSSRRRSSILTQSKIST